MTDAVGHDVDRLADQVRHIERALPRGVVEHQAAVHRAAVDRRLGDRGEGVGAHRTRQDRGEGVIEALDVPHGRAVDDASHDHPRLLAIAHWDGGHRFERALGVVPGPAGHLLVAVDGARDHRAIGAHRPQELIGLLLVGHRDDAAFGDVLGQHRQILGA
jgi:hypothetical protein